MNILVFSHNERSIGNDHYTAMRSEGRIPVNIGFGLSLLGHHNIDIIGPNYIERKNIFRNVSLIKNPRDIEYDIVFLWSQSTRLNNIKYKKVIFMVDDPEEVIDAITNIPKNLTVVCAYKNIIKRLKELTYNQTNNQTEIEYLPPLFPIPEINIGFLPFHKLFHKPNNQKLTIFLYISSWEVDDKGLKEYSIILNQFKDYELTLHVQIYKDQAKPEFLKDYKTHYLVSPFSYLELIQILKQCDLCIIKGGYNDASASMYDIISLGKSMIYVADGLCKDNNFKNPLYENHNELIFYDDSEERIKRKVNELLINPESKYKEFKNIMKDNNFNNWMNFALMKFRL